MLRIFVQCNRAAKAISAFLPDSIYHEPKVAWRIDGRGRGQK